jgi:hypothetical protein
MLALFGEPRYEVRKLDWVAGESFKIIGPE